MRRMKCAWISFLCVALFCSCGGKSVEGLTGKVTLDGYDGRMVYLETTTIPRETVDSARVKDNRFSFTFSDSVPQVYCLVLGMSDNDEFPITLPVVSEKGHVKVSMGELVLTMGTPLNDNLQDFLLAVSNFTDKAIADKEMGVEEMKTEFAKLVEGAVMQNISTPVGAYIFRTYKEKLSEEQKALILNRADGKFKDAVK